MVHRRHAEIAGAGFAGLATAIALRQRGWTVRVHEREPALRAFGAGIFIWENGLRVLDALGALEDVLRGAHEAPLYEARDGGNAILRQDRFSVAERGSRMLTMTRQHLYAAVLAAAEQHGVAIETGSDAVGADPEGVLRTADGRAWPADLVVGADGVRSRVRDSLGIPVERRRYETNVIRLMVDRAADDLGGPGGGRDSVISFWTDRYRVLYVPCGATELYLLLGANAAEPEATVLPVDKRLWSAAYPFLTPILDRISAQGRSDAYETTRMTSWSAGCVAVLGDAAHAMPPTLGQGAGAAMANGLGLAVAIETAGGVLDGLRAWEATERPMIDYTQDVSERHAETRAGHDGSERWTDEALKPARSVPTGTRASI
jgi:2-methyl-3-hydroxypyridine 5-carboxylic acid dioxygenase